APPGPRGLARKARRRCGGRDRLRRRSAGSTRGPRDGRGTGRACCADCCTTKDGAKGTAARVDSAAMHRALDPALPILALVALAAAGCDDDPPKAKPGPTASATLSATPTAAQLAPAASKPKGMPELTVDDDGPYLNGTRINLADPNANGPEKLSKVT